jgi:hypothetical protein
MLEMGWESVDWIDVAQGRDTYRSWEHDSESSRLG